MPPPVLKPLSLSLQAVVRGVGRAIPLVPCRRARSRQRLAPLAVLVLLLAGAVASRAQDVTEPALKAAFIYNFAKFTEWPDAALPAGAPFVMCVFGDAAVGDALGRTVRGQDVAGHRILVSKLTAAEPPRGCHVLYVSGVASGEAAQVVSPVRDGPVLTISDIDGFTQAGGIVQFFFDRGRLRFAVQQDSAKRARLHISSRLLTLAKRS